ncbi:hypothetical protein I4U23_011606 [Adineta vaga]|nr:hypothetical protein I4U23_011606 [Adineta vaga]
MDKENFRFYIKVRTALNVQTTTIHDELRAVFGDEAPSFRTFCEGREEIKDEQRSGRSVTETTLANIEPVRSIVDDDPYITIDDPSPTIVRRSRLAPTTLFCIFFKSTGPILIHRIESKQTVDH